MEASEVEAVKSAARQTWASGDYNSIAQLVWEVGDRIVARLDIAADEDVLDIACGTGNAAIPAAQAGGRIVGVDLTPELFEKGRALAAEAGVEIEWVEGDAEALPFDDESFDVVVSTFGVMFAPRHDVAAGELARVMRPGARMGLCNWTPEGPIGEFFKTVGSHMPEPPPFASPPPMWGNEDHVRELFDGKGIELEFERETVEIRFDSAEEAVKEYESKFGPVIKARELLVPQGKWPQLREEMVQVFERNNVSEQSGFVFPAEYLVVVGKKQA